MAKAQDDPPAHNFPRAIGSPATSALLHAGYTQLEELTKLTARAVGKLHGVGPKAVAILKATLAEKGLAFAEEPPKPSKKRE